MLTTGMIIKYPHALVARTPRERLIIVRDGGESRRAASESAFQNLKFNNKSYMPLWHSADEKVTKCHVRGEGR